MLAASQSAARYTKEQLVTLSNFRDMIRKLTLSNEPELADHYTKWLLLKRNLWGLRQ